MSVIVPFDDTDVDDFAAWAREVRETRRERISRPPRIRMFDGDWNYRGTATNWVDGEVTLKLNDVGSVAVELPILHGKWSPFTGSDLDDFAEWTREIEDHRSTFLAHWALDQQARGTTNIHVVVDKDGARVGSRVDPDKGPQLEVSKDGSTVLFECLEDTQELKHVHMAAAPFLPVSLIQQPKVQFLWAPSDWGGKASLAMNLFRLQGTNFNMNLDVLDPSTWSGGLWAQSQIVVMPGRLSDSIAPTTIITGTIKQPWLDVMAPILEDAELQVVTRRWLKGDPEPWAGAGTNWRNGTLFVDIVDKSGWQTGTSLGGNLATGLVRSIAGVTSNYVEDTYDLLTGEPANVDGYKRPFWLFTGAAAPYVVYRDGEITGVEDFKFNQAPGGPCKITAGGQSMPGVNELLEAVIGYAGDVLGDNLVINGYGVGSLGNILNAFLMPILKNSILAFMSVPLIGRAAQQGWGHYLETAATGVTQAYTPASLMDLRKRRRETDPDNGFSFSVANATPWLIGDNGQGHWWLGDRVGATTRLLGAKVFVTRCRELNLPLSNSEAPMWSAKFGDLKSQQDAGDKAIALVATTAAALQEIGLG